MGLLSKLSMWKGFQRSCCYYISSELSSNNIQKGLFSRLCNCMPSASFNLQHYTGFVIVDELLRSWWPGWYFLHGYNRGSDVVVVGLVLWAAPSIWMTHVKQFSSFMTDNLLVDLVWMNKRENILVTWLVQLTQWFRWSSAFLVIHDNTVESDA